MKKIITALEAEFIKTRKAKIVMVTCMFFVFISLMMGLMLFVSKNPEIASKLGMIGTKARMFGENDWSGYLAMILQLIAAIGLIGFGFVASWMFGNEHVSRTFKDILALPVSRPSIVMAKFIVTVLWCAVLSLILYLFTFLMGLLVCIPGLSEKLFLSFTSYYFKISLFTFLLCTPVAWLAGFSRGLTAPLGMVVLTLIMAQFAGLIGLAPYFPWAIPGLISVHNDGPGFKIQTASYIILVITFIAGYWGTDYWWRRADHH